MKTASLPVTLMTLGQSLAHRQLQSQSAGNKVYFVTWIAKVEFIELIDISTRFDGPNASLIREERSSAMHFFRLCLELE